jgi:hypothetical protein
VIADHFFLGEFLGKKLPISPLAIPKIEGTAV